jgi:S1-C subfamily serine protease
MSIWPRLSADLLAGACALLLASAPARAEPPSVAAVETGLRLGVAFDLGGGRWATAAHVVCGLAPGARVRLRGVGPATIVGRAEGLDLAILSAPSGRGLETGDPPSAGALVSAIGPGREGLRTMPGEASGQTLWLPVFGEGFVVRLDGAGPGFSGGPLRGADGRTLGMVVAVRRGALGATEAFVLPAGAVRAAAGRAYLPPPSC